MGKGIRITEIIIGIILFIVGAYKISTIIKEDNKQVSAPTTNVGDFVENKDGVKFCITNIDNQKSLNNNDIQTDNNFIIVSVKIINNSKKPYDVNSLRFVLTDGELEYEYDENALLYVENPMYLDTINPNITKEYTIVYETPYTSFEHKYKMEIKHIGLSNKDSVFILLDSKGDGSE